MKKTFQYKIKSNLQTEQKAEKWLSLCQQLYNDSLNERIIAYKENKKSISQYEQMKRLPQLKKVFPEFKSVNSQTLQDVIQRLDKAYQGFFRRVKAKNGKAGFPRFKGQNRYDSFTLKQTGWKLNNNYLEIKNIGSFKLFLSRPIEGNIKTLTIRRTLTNKWLACFSCENVPQKLLPKTNKEIAIDVGCQSFLTDSKGNKIDNPRFFKNSQDVLAARQQKLSQKVKGSYRKSKARLLVAKIHQKIFNQRKDFHFKTVNKLIKENDKIYIEKFNSFKSFKGLNKSMRDAAWFQFFNTLRFKAVEAGKEVIEVPAKNTSQICSKCGRIVEKDLSVRVHKCLCGSEIDRDWNAALNILRLGQSLRVTPRIS
ncbi:MAG: transposase [Candidatus Portnoybacteria bacterium CG03_land_8_20_14_0_80_41_10]|uniref:Transposase n=1 Tax=Candidatus Portnoybacteria bacterium CG03_land_8_20_14_0_80_41_10 TaxID=1974808 RepID=A0A2M7BV52_9BACT|nr:MAG: transposase [Candidatus Portnoybacteria bacterium CG03_land_8_20_14_0_80_41_10]